MRAALCTVGYVGYVRYVRRCLHSMCAMWAMCGAACHRAPVRPEHITDLWAQHLCAVRQGDEDAVDVAYARQVRAQQIRQHWQRLSIHHHL